MSMDAKIYENYVFGKLALKQLGTVSENFRLFEARMSPQAPQEWTEMVVTGAEFDRATSGENKGKLMDLIHGTERTVRVSRKDIQASSGSETDLV
ncbi:hypothetical protein DZC30_18815 [Comamonas testosteroni]|uniref:Uncharacterized protein n=1 Tax=Comamonas testosteroni TaxID=285 RepID=A0A373FCY2_COMTE|nr:hypothetical protein [Comamonas testosteroni]RGE41362.1 hypothetical protein DZC30_18815 [Comamonas testosteroni]